jgi:predicted PurR-regulated permease PerM
VKFLGRLRRHLPGQAASSAEPALAAQAAHALDETEEEQLSSVFEPPRWLNDLGRASWLLVGVFALIVGLVWLLGQTATITVPVLLGLVLATVASPIVNVLQRRRVPRVAGALLVLLGLVALGLLILLLVVGGLVAQSDAISQYANQALATIQTWLDDAGIDSSGAESTTQNLRETVPDLISTFVTGLANTISGITSLVFGISFTIFSLFFLLKDGPKLRIWVDDHLGVPPPVARAITGNVITSLRRYFTGVTIVAAFNAVVVGLGAIVLDVPLAGTIAVVTFVTAYVPFIGAFVSGAFAVMLALAAGGTETALVMLVIVLLANGMLQNIVQPIAFGATLNLNPLLVLVVTIAAGSLFGMIGLILAAPLVSAGVNTMREVGRIRTASVRQ